MYQKLFGFVLLYCFLMKIECYTPAGLVGANYTSVVNETTFYLLRDLAEESRKLAEGRNRIETAVAEAQESIQHELDELVEYIEDTKEEAEEDGLDIENCINQTNFTNIDVSSSFKRCKSPSQLGVLNFHKQTLAKISASFPEEVNICIFKQVLGVDLENCLNEKIKEIEKRVARIDATIDALLSVAIENSFRCIEATLIKLDNYMNKAARKFESCIAEIMNLDK